MVEIYAIIEINYGHVTTAFKNLFLVLSTWDSSGDLTLDIYVSSHSGLNHCVKFPTSTPDIPPTDIRRMLHAIVDEVPFDNRQLKRQWWDQLPSGPRVNHCNLTYTILLGMLWWCTGTGIIGMTAASG